MNSKTPGQSPAKFKVCEECKLTFEDGKKLRWHRYYTHETHTPSGRRTDKVCDHCGMAFNDGTKLRWHCYHMHQDDRARRKSDPSVVQCSVKKAPDETKGRDASSEGKKNKSSETKKGKSSKKGRHFSAESRGRECEECDATFSTQTELVWHMNGRHGANLENDCFVCGFAHKNENAFLRHLNKHCVLDDVFECPVCLDILEDGWSLNCHVESEHMSEVSYKSRESSFCMPDEHTAQKSLWKPKCGLPWGKKQLVSKPSW